MLRQEAAFGMAEIGRVITDRFAARKRLACLEVGAGVGFLLRALHDRFPDHHFEGIEPIAVEAGFVKTIAAAKRAPRDPAVDIHPCCYSAFRPADAYDVVFSVNVAEHLPSWQDYLVRTYRWLAPGGVSVMLCPNYAFPWESHFQMPIVFGKRMTERLLGDAIAAFEERHGCPGLWNGLSFIKRADVSAFLTAQRIRFAWDDGIMDRMVARLVTDPHFAQRQGTFASLARFAQRLKLMALLRHAPVNRFAPYMMLTITKP